MKRFEYKKLKNPSREKTEGLFSDGWRYFAAHVMSPTDFEVVYERELPEETKDN